MSRSRRVGRSFLRSSRRTAASLHESSGKAGVSPAAGSGLERPVLESLEDRKLLFSLTIDPDIFLAQQLGLVGPATLLDGDPSNDQLANITAAGFEDDYAVVTDPATGIVSLVPTGTGDGIASVTGWFGYLAPILGDLTAGDDVTRSDLSDTEEDFDGILEFRDGTERGLEPGEELFRISQANPFFGLDPDFNTDTALFIQTSGTGVEAIFVERQNIEADEDDDAMGMPPMPVNGDFETEDDTGDLTNSDDVDLQIDFGSATLEMIEWLDANNEADSRGGTGTNSRGTGFTRNPDYDPTSRPYVSIQLNADPEDTNGDGEPDSVGDQFAPLFQALYNATDNLNPLGDGSGIYDVGLLQQSINSGVVSVEYYRSGVRLDNFNADNDINSTSGGDFATYVPGLGLSELGSLQLPPGADNPTNDANIVGTINTIDQGVDGAGNPIILSDFLPGDGIVNNFDFNGDGLLDFADLFDWNGNGTFFEVDPNTGQLVFGAGGLPNLDPGDINPFTNMVMGDGVVDNEFGGTYRLAYGVQVEDILELEDMDGMSVLTPDHPDVRDEPETPFGEVYGTTPSTLIVDLEGDGPGDFDQNGVGDAAVHPSALPGADPRLDLADLSQVTADDVFDEIRFVFTPTQVGQTASFFVDDLTLLQPAGDFVEEVTDRLRSGVATITGPIGASATFYDLYDRPLYSVQLEVDAPDTPSITFPGVADELERDVVNGYFEAADVGLLLPADGVDFLLYDPNDDGRPDGRIQTFEVPRDLNGDGSFGGFLDVNDNGIFDPGVDIPETSQDFPEDNNGDGIISFLDDTAIDNNFDGRADGDGAITPGERGDQRVFEAGIDGLGRIELVGFNEVDPLTGAELDSSQFSFTLGGGTFDAVPMLDPQSIPLDSLGFWNAIPVDNDVFTLSNFAADAGPGVRFHDSNVFVILPDDLFSTGEELEEARVGFFVNDIPGGGAGAGGDGDIEITGLPDFAGNAIVGSNVIRDLTPPVFDAAGNIVPGLEGYLNRVFIGSRSFVSVLSLSDGVENIAQQYLDDVLRQGIQVGRILESFDFEIATGPAGSVFDSRNTSQFGGSGIDILRGFPLVGPETSPLVSTAGLSNAFLDTDTVAIRADGTPTSAVFSGGASRFGADAQVLRLELAADDQMGQGVNTIAFRRQLDPSGSARGSLSSPDSGVPGSSLSSAMVGLSGVRMQIRSVSEQAGQSSTVTVQLRKDFNRDGRIDETEVVQEFTNVGAGSVLLESTNGEFDTVVIINEDTQNASTVVLESIELIEAPKDFGDITLDATVFGDVETRGALRQYSSVYQLSSVSVGGDLGRYIVSTDAGYIENDPDGIDATTPRDGGVTGATLTVGRTLGNFFVGGRSYVDVSVGGLLSEPDEASASTGVVHYEIERTLDPFSFDGVDNFDDTELYNAWLTGELQAIDQQVVSFNREAAAAPIVGEGYFRNDSLGSAEFVHASSGSAFIVGEIGGADVVNTQADSVDVYAFAADGSRPVVIENLFGDTAAFGFESESGNDLATAGDAPVQDVFFRVVNQDGVVVASEQTNPRGIRTVNRLEFVPDEPGVYYLVVASGTAGGNNQQVAYTVSLQGLAPVTLGAYRTGQGLGEDPTVQLIPLSINEDSRPRIEIAGGDAGLITVGTGHFASGGGTTTIRELEGNNSPEDGTITRDIRDIQVDVAGDLFQFNAAGNIVGGGSGPSGVAISVGGDLAQFFTGRADGRGIGVEANVGFGDVTQLDLEVGGRIGRFDIGGGLGTDLDGAAPRVGGSYVIRTGVAESAESGDIGVFRTQSVVETGGQTDPFFVLDVSAVPGSSIGLMSINERSNVFANNGGFSQEPTIILGEDGDIRFFDVPQLNLVDVDAETLLLSGVPVDFVDDAGGVLTVTFTAGTDDDGLPLGGAATVTVVPIDGSAGVAISRIEADLSGGGTLQIQSSLTGTTDVVSIGRIFIEGADENSQILIDGAVEVDVYRIDQASPDGQGDGGDALGLIRNSTPGGDIVAIDVNDLGTLEIVDGNLGRTQTPAFGPSQIGPLLGLASTLQTDVGSALGFTGTAFSQLVNAPVGVLRPVGDGVFSGDNFYFEDQGIPLDPYLNGLVVRSGSIGQVLVGRGVGDVILQQTNEVIGQVVANNLANFDPGREFSGIFGNIYSAGDIVEVRVGDGLLGRADTPLLDVGIIAEDSIDLVRAGGSGNGLINGASIEGVILAGSVDTNVTQTTDANGVVTITGSGFAVIDANGTNIVIDGIGEVLVEGGGSISGAYISVSNIDAFYDGLIDGAETFAGSIGRIDVDGPNGNVFGTEFDAIDIFEITVDGAFDASSLVVLDDLGSIVPFFSPEVFGTVEFGSIRNSTVGGDLTELTPTLIEVGDDLNNFTVIGDISDLSIEVDERIVGGITARNIARTSISVDTSISSIVTSEGFLSSTVVAGELSLVQAGGAIRASSFEVSGTLDVFEATGDIVATAISVTGPSGQINRIESLSGSIREIELLSSGPIDILRAAVDLGGTLTTTDPNDSVNLIQAGRDLLIETDFAGDLDQLIAGRNIGAPGIEDTIRVRGNLSAATAGAALAPALGAAPTIAGVDGSGQIYSDIRVDLNITGAITIDGVSGSFALGRPEIVAFGQINQVDVTGDFGGLIRSASNGISDINISGSLLKGGRIDIDDGSLGFAPGSGLFVGENLEGDVFVERTVFDIEVVGDVGLADGGTTGIDGSTIFVGDNLGRLIVGGDFYESFVYAGRTLLDVSIAGDVGLTQRDGRNSGSATGLAQIIAGVAGEDGIYLDDPNTEADETADNVAAFTTGDYAVRVDTQGDGISSNDALILTVTAQDATGQDVVLEIVQRAGGDGAFFTADDTIATQWDDVVGPNGDISEQDVLLAAVGAQDPTNQNGFGVNGDFRFFRLDADDDGIDSGVDVGDVYVVQILAADAEGRVSVLTGEISDGTGALAGDLATDGAIDRFDANLLLGPSNVIAAGDQIGADNVFNLGVGNVTIGGNARDIQILAGLDEVGNERVEDLFITGQRPGGVNFGAFTFNGQTIDSSIDRRADVITGGAIVDGDGVGTGEDAIVIAGQARDVAVTAGVAAGFDGVYNTLDDQVVLGFGRVDSISLGSVSNAGDVSIYTDRRNVVVNVGNAAVETRFSAAAENSATFVPGGGASTAIGDVSLVQDSLPGRVRFGGDLFNVNPLANRGEQFAGDPLARPLPDMPTNAQIITDGETISLPTGQVIRVDHTGLSGNSQILFINNPADGGNARLYLVNTRAEADNAADTPDSVTLTLVSGNRSTARLDIISNDDASLDTLQTVGFSLSGQGALASEIIVDLLAKNVIIAGFDSTGRVLVGGDIQNLTIGGDADLGTTPTLGAFSANFVRSVVVLGQFGQFGSNLLASVGSLDLRGAGSVRIEGNLFGEIVVRRSISALNGIAAGEQAGITVDGQVRRAVIRAGETIDLIRVNATLNSDGTLGNAVSESRFSVGDNIGIIDINNGSVFDTAFQAGGDLGSDGRPDLLTGNADDRVSTGFIASVEIDGTFRESDIIIGALRGSDGFFGTGDDSLAAGLGTLGPVRILNLDGVATADTVGSDNDSESYSISVAGPNAPDPASITIGGVNAQSFNNFVIQPFATDAEALEVLDVVVAREEGEIYVATARFNQEVNIDTVADALTVTEVRSDGTEVRASLTTSLTAGQYRIEQDPEDRNAVRIVFARAVTQRDLDTGRSSARLSEANVAGLYRFDFADETSPVALQGRVASAVIDADTSRSFYAVVGDAGDNADGTPFDPQDGNVITATVPGDRVDLYEAVNLDAALNSAREQTGVASFTVRGITGDHPDEIAGEFTNAADIDRYNLTLEAGQILLIERDVLGPANDIFRSLAPTSTGIFQQIDTPVPSLGTDVFEDDFAALETEFIQVHILESDTFTLTVTAPENTFTGVTGSTAFGNNGLLLQSGGNSGELNVNDVNIPTSALGSYAFDLVVFDDGDSGFTSGDIVSSALGDAAPQASDAGDGTDLLRPNDIFTRAARGLAGQTGIYVDDGSSDAAFDNALPTFVDGDYTYTATPGADGLLFTDDDVIRVEVAADIGSGVTIPLVFEVRDGGDGFLFSEAPGTFNDDIVNFDPAQTFADPQVLTAFRNVILDAVAGPDNQYVNDPQTDDDETADNITETPVTIGDLTVTFIEGDDITFDLNGVQIDNTLENDDDAIFIELNALTRDFVNLLPDLDLVTAPNDAAAPSLAAAEADNDFGQGFLYDPGTDFVYGTADDRLVIVNPSGESDGLDRITTDPNSDPLAPDTTPLGNIAKQPLVDRIIEIFAGADGDYTTGVSGNGTADTGGADNLTPEIINGSFRARSAAGDDGILFTSDDTIGVTLETIDPVTGARSTLLTDDANMTPAQYTITAGVDGQLFTADDRITSGAMNNADAFNALAFADGTELFARIDGFDYTYTALTQGTASSAFAGGSADESFDNLAEQVVFDSTGNNAVAITLRTGDGITYNNDDVAVFEVRAERDGETVSIAFGGVASAGQGALVDADNAAGVQSLVFLDADASLVGAGDDGILGLGYSVTDRIDLNLTTPQNTNPLQIVEGEFGRTVNGAPVRDLIVLSPNENDQADVVSLAADGNGGFLPPSDSQVGALGFSDFDFDNDGVGDEDVNDDNIADTFVTRSVVALDVGSISDTNGIQGDDIVAVYFASFDVNALVDSNNDGDFTNDIDVTRAYTEIFEGSTPGAQAAPEFTPPVGTTPERVAFLGANAGGAEDAFQIVDIELGDFSGDGRDDLVIAYQNGFVELRRFNPVGNSFDAEAQLVVSPTIGVTPATPYSQRIAIGNVDADAQGEIVIAADAGVEIIDFVQFGTSTTRSISAGAQPIAVTLADLDASGGTGALDIIVTNQLNRDPFKRVGELAILRADANEPDGFADPEFTDVGVGPSQVVVTNLDNVPGRPTSGADIVVANASGSLSIFRGLGDGIFTDADNDGLDDDGLEGTFAPEIRTPAGIGSGSFVVIPGTASAGASDAENGAVIATFSDVTDQVLILEQTGSADDGLFSLLAGPNGIYADAVDANGNRVESLSDNRFDLMTGAVDLPNLGDFTLNVAAGADGDFATNDDIITLDIANVATDNAGATGTLTLTLDAGEDGILLTADDRVRTEAGTSPAVLGALNAELAAVSAINNPAGNVNVNLFEALAGTDGAYIDLATTLNGDTLRGVDRGGSVIFSGVQESTIGGLQGQNAIVTTIESAVGQVSAAGQPNSLFTDIDIFHIGDRQPIAAGSTVRVTVELDEIGSDIGGGLSSAGSTQATQAQLAIFDTTTSRNITDAKLLLAPTDFSGRAFDETPIIASDDPDVPTTYGLDENGNFFVEFVSTQAIELGASATEGASYAIYIQGQVQADYAVRVEVAQQPAPTREQLAATLQQQNIFIEFGGGRIDWLLTGGRDVDLIEFDAADLGFVGRSPEDDEAIQQTIIDSVIQNVNTYFDFLSSFNEATGADQGVQINVAADLGNLPGGGGDFEFDEFSTIYVTSSASPFGFQSSESSARFLEDSFSAPIPLFGVTERSDALNVDRDDEGVIFVGDTAAISGVGDLDTLDDFINSLSITIIRQIGELMGLRQTTSLVTQNAAFGTLSSLDEFFLGIVDIPLSGTDSDGDGVINGIDDDDDNDGIPDDGIIFVDTDGDGTEDTFFFVSDPDSDGDGLLDFPALNSEPDVNGDGLPDDLDGDGFADFPFGIPGLPGVNPNQTPTSIDPMSIDAPLFAFDRVDLASTGVFGSINPTRPFETGDRSLISQNQSSSEFFFPTTGSPIAEFLLGQQSSELLLDRILETVN